VAKQLEDLRKLKDQATRAIEKRAYDRAAALYVEIAGREPEPDWRQRAGEAFRRAGEPQQAVEQLERAADGYAKGGFLLKAIAVCKTILQIDPSHTTTQRALADLYAKRDGKAAPPPQILEPHATHVPPPLVQVEPPPAGDASRLAITEALDAHTTSPTQPIDVLPLHRVLGGRRSEQIAVADVAMLAAAEEPAAYEITLDDAEVVEEGVEITLDAEPALPTIPLFSSLLASELQLLIERVGMRELPAGEVVLRQGEPGDALYVVADGAVRVTTHDRELARLEAGAFFGELGLLTDEPRSATVTSEGCTLLEISREVAWDVIRGAPDVLRTMLRFFRDRMLDRLMSSSPLFSALEAADARTLADEFVFLELESGATAVKQGARAPGLFFVVCGEVEAVRDGARLGKLGPGDVFGEMSLLDRSPASADVRATRKAWVLELPAQRFQEIMLTYPQVLAYVSELGDARRQALAATKTPAPEKTVDLLDLLSDERIDLL